MDSNNKANHDDGEDILMGMVPYDEEEERRVNAPSEEEEEFFDMEMVENEMSSDYTAETFFITRPSPRRTITPSQESTPQETSRPVTAQPLEAPQPAAAQETPTLSCESSPSFSMEEESSVEGQARCEPQPSSSAQPAESAVAKPGEQRPCEPQKVSESYLVSGEHETQSMSQVSEDYSPVYEQQREAEAQQYAQEYALPIAEAQYPEEYGQQVMDGQYQEYPQEYDQQAMNGQYQEYPQEYEQQAMDEQMPAPDQPQESTPEVDHTVSPIKHLKNSPWAPQIEEAQPSPYMANNVSGHAVFQPNPDAFTIPQDNTWSLDEYFTEASEGNETTNTEEEIVENNYSADLYSTDDRNAEHAMSSTELPHCTETEERVTNNPEGIPAPESEDGLGSSPSSSSNSSMCKEARGESAQESEESSGNTPSEESSLDELFKDCPPIDPSIFKNARNQPGPYSFGAQHSEHVLRSQQEAQEVEHSQAVQQPVFQQKAVQQPAFQQQAVQQPVFQQQAVQQPVFQQQAVQQPVFQPMPAHFFSPQGQHRDLKSIPTTPFQKSTTMPGPETVFNLPHTNGNPISLKTVPTAAASSPEESVVCSKPSPVMQFAFCNGHMIISSAIPSVTNPKKLLPTPIKTVALEVSVPTTPLRHKSTQDLVSALVEDYALPCERAAHPLNYLVTKSAGTISPREPERIPVNATAEYIPELSEDINTLLLQNNWAEAFFQAASDKKSLEVLQLNYTKSSTKNASDHAYLLLSTGCEVPESLFDHPDVVDRYQYVLKGIVMQKNTQAATFLADALFKHGKITEAVITILVSGAVEQNLDKIYDVNALLVYNKLHPQHQDALSKRVKEILKNLAHMNSKRAKDIYKENKDIFSKSDKKELEDALGIEGSSWGIQGIINAVDKGITRMVSTPMPATPLAMETPKERPAFQHEPAKEATPLFASASGLGKSPSVANSQPESASSPHIPMPKIPMGNPNAPRPRPQIVRPASIPMPQIPKNMQRQEVSKAEKPAAYAMPGPMPSAMPNTMPAASTQTASPAIPPMQPAPTAAPAEEVDEDKIDYRALYSDKSRYQMLESAPERGSWLGYIPGASALSGIVKKLAGRGNLPVVNLSDDTTFIFDKQLKKWITVNSTTLKPIKIEVTQRRPEDPEPTVSGKPKPMPMPVITGKMPKRGPDGKLDFGPVGKSLEARYGKPMIQSSIDTTIQDVAPAFPMPAVHSNKNTKVFIPKFPAPETENTTS
ncbi:uncharacterized protein NEMAJ01_0155 [Nematocida major]|uniref:uncharacterized protein n=1 Tax=Nematocida major TaxID=1912982 RepID=UPI0020079546|nr:uncharacterized protein NEMAJ01_0155 [Nematocida major]KAH9385259.1 hypothetical protein NEMAJ01_0155 [Nematocida major]